MQKLTLTTTHWHSKEGDQRHTIEREADEIALDAGEHRLRAIGYTTTDEKTGYKTRVWEVMAADYESAVVDTVEQPTA